MGIKFPCPTCGKVINVKTYLAGKRGFCPKCQARVDIPLTSTHTAEPQQPRIPDKPAATAELEPTIAYTPPEVVTPASPASTAPATAATADPAPPPTPSAAPAASSVEAASAAPAAATPAVVSPAAASLPAAVVPPTAPAPSPTSFPANAAPTAPSTTDPLAHPHLHWYVMPAGSQTPYGPATGQLLRQWVSEGRVAADSLVWRQDWTQWLRAGSVLPELQTPAPPPAGVSRGVPVAAMPAVAIPPAAVPALGVPVATNPQTSTYDPTVVRPTSRRRGNLIILLILVGMIAVLAPFVVQAIRGKLANPLAPKPASLHAIDVGSRSA